MLYVLIRGTVTQVHTFVRLFDLSIKIYEFYCM